MLAHDAVGNRQPESGALANGLGREEGIVNARQVLGSDAVAGVGHLGHHFPAVSTSRNGEPAAAAHGVSGVQEEVEEHLLKLELEPDDAHRLGVEFAAHLDAALLELVFEQRQHVGNDHIEIDDSSLRLFRGAGPRQVEQAVDDARGAEGLLLDLLQHRCARIRRVGVLQQHLRVAGDAGERCVHLVRHSRGQQAERRHLLRDAQLLFHLRPLGDVLDDDDGAGLRAAGHGLEWHRRDVHQQAGAIQAVAGHQRDPEDRGPVRVVATSQTHQVDQVRIEEPVDVLTEHGCPLEPMDALECPVPAYHVVRRPQHQQPIVERLEDVFVKSVEAIQFRGLEVQLAIQAAVLDRGGGLRGDGRDERGVFTAERLAAGATAQREHGNGGIFRDARHEVEDAGVAPELDFFSAEPGGGQRIVEANGVGAIETGADTRRRGETGRRALEALVADDFEVAGIGRQQKRHAIQLDGLAHAGDQPVGQPVQVEVAVQLPGETDQRAAIVVAIAVEGAVDGLLQAVLHRLGEQDHDDRGQEGDDPAVLRFTVEQAVARRAQD